MRFSRLLAVAVAGTFGLTGCAYEPPPVSDKVAQYYSNPPTYAPKEPEPLQVTSLPDIKAMVKGTAPLTVSVLGDSTSNDTDEWVHLWAQHLAHDATVTVLTWKEDAAIWPSVTYGKGSRQITIWNGSMPGSSGMYARVKFETIQPANVGLIIYNYGHNASPSGVVADIDTLQRMAQTRNGAGVPFVVTLQNASRGAYRMVSATAVDELRPWTAVRGVPIIDVAVAIRSQNLDALLLDEVHPNPKGSIIWADVVAETLG